MGRDTRPPDGDSEEPESMTDLESASTDELVHELASRKDAILMAWLDIRTDTESAVFTFYDGLDWQLDALAAKIRRTANALHNDDGGNHY